MFSYLTLIFGFLVGVWCSHLAIQQKRNPYLWFFIGLFFGLIGVAAIFFLKSKKQKEERKTTSVFVAPPSVAQKLWYYLEGTENPLGPMSFHALKRAWDEKKVTPTTYIWNEELDRWKKIEEFPEIQKILKEISTSSP